MTKKDTFVPIMIFALSGLFIVISAAVFLSRGKSKFWLTKKMKIGALLLTFSSFSVQQSCVTCYEPVPGSYIILDSANRDTVKLNFNLNNKITGKLRFGQVDDTIRFTIIDTFNINKLQEEGAATITDGVIDEEKEDFYFDVNKSIKTGTYNLKAEVGKHFRNYKLVILNEN